MNTYLEVDNGQHESLISYEILAAIYCCYLMLTKYCDKYRPQTTLDTGDDSHGPTHTAYRGDG